LHCQTLQSRIANRCIAASLHHRRFCIAASRIAVTLHRWTLHRRPLYRCIIDRIAASL
jgi:hypothetical protein